VTHATLINGAMAPDSTHAIDASDRGLNYGDGVFETMRMTRGRVRFWDLHAERLRTGCERLGIACPANATLQSDIEQLRQLQPDGVVKLVLTRGAGARGYRPLANGVPTRIATLHDLPTTITTKLRLRWCDMRLSRNPALAGIKHLNRLEHVLAQREWDDASIDEGLMLDSEGELVCATAANVFIVRGGELATADLRYCGVRGVMREAVLRTARNLGIPVHEEPLWPEDLETASEVFVTNAVRGIRSATSLDAHTWVNDEIARAISRALDTHA